MSEDMIHNFAEELAKRVNSFEITCDDDSISIYNKNNNNGYVCSLDFVQGGIIIRYWDTFFPGEWFKKKITVRYCDPNECDIKKIAKVIKIINQKREIMSFS